MTRAPVLLILTAAGFAATAGGWAWLLARYLPGFPVGAIVMDLGPIQKLAVMLIVLLTFGAVLLGGIGLVARDAAGPVRLLLTLTAAGSAALGAMAALYGWMTIQAAIRAIGPVSFEVTAPGYAETLLVLSIGLFGALIALGFRALMDRRG